MDSVDMRSGALPRVTTDDVKLQSVLRRHFDGRSSMIVRSNSVDDMFKFHTSVPWDSQTTTEWISRPASQDRYILLPLPINFDSLVVWTTAARGGQWLWASSACNETKCLSGSSLSHLAQVIPGDPNKKTSSRQVIRLSLVKLYDKHFTHLVVLHSKSRRIGGEWFLSEERDVTMSLPSVTAVVTGREEQVTLVTLPQATHYMVALPAIRRVWDVYTVSVSPVKCWLNQTTSSRPSLTSHSLVRLHSPSHREDVYRWVSPHDLTTNLTLATFHPLSDDLSHQVTHQVTLALYLTPACIYHLVFRHSLRDSLGQLFRHHAVLVPSYVVLVLLTSLVVQLSAWRRTDSCPSLGSVAFPLTFLMAPFIALTSQLTASLHSSGYTNIVDHAEMLPAVFMFLVSSAVVSLLARITAGFIYYISVIIGFMARKCNISVGCDHMYWLHYGVVVICVILACQLCGALSLALAVIWYFIRLIIWRCESKKDVYHFNTTLFFLWTFVVCVNVPTFVVWIKNIAFSVSLHPDPSFPHTLVLLASCACFVRTAHRNTDSSLWVSVWSQCAVLLASVVVTLSATVSMYRLPYIISSLLALLSFNHLMVSLGSSHTTTPVKDKRQ